MRYARRYEIPPMEAGWTLPSGPAGRKSGWPGFFPVASEGRLRRGGREQPGIPPGWPRCRDRADG